MDVNVMLLNYLLLILPCAPRSCCLFRLLVYFLMFSFASGPDKVNRSLETIAPISDKSIYVNLNCLFVVCCNSQCSVSNIVLLFAFVVIYLLCKKIVCQFVHTYVCTHLYNYLAWNVGAHSFT